MNNSDERDYAEEQANRRLLEEGDHDDAGDSCEGLYLGGLALYQAIRRGISAQWEADMSAGIERSPEDHQSVLANAATLAVFNEKKRLTHVDTCDCAGWPPKRKAGA